MNKADPVSGKEGRQEGTGQGTGGGRCPRHAVRSAAEDREADGRNGRLLAVGDKLLTRLDQAAEAGDAMEPLALQRLAAALKTLQVVADAGKDPAAVDAGGLSVTFEGDAKEAAE